MAELPFERELDARHGEVAQVSPLIRRVICNNPGPFTFTGTGTYIVGEGQVAVIDPGPNDEAHLQALVEAVAGETVSHIIITHTHMDHSPLAKRLKSMTGARTYGYGPHGAGQRQRRPVESGDVTLDASGDVEFVPDQTLEHGDVIAGKGWTLESVFTPGHTSNHMAFALKEENALFSGDHVMAWSTSVIIPPDGNMAEYMASLKLLLERSDEVYWPTHGPEKREPSALVRGFVTHRRMREDAIFKRVKEGDRTIARVVETVYAAVDKRLHPAAALSTLAHMEHLVEQGRVVTDGEPQMNSEYRVG